MDKDKEALGINSSMVEHYQQQIMDQIRHRSPFQRILGSGPYVKRQPLLFSVKDITVQVYEDCDGCYEASGERDKDSSYYIRLEDVEKIIARYVTERER